jgi:methylated-DNA-[protein]-cysteine S-methyltransferase
MPYILILPPNMSRELSTFAKQVYIITSKVPKGKVTTYGQIAVTLGKIKGARAVGGALHNNPFAPKVPCHRVVMSNGKLGGFASGTKKKADLLKLEGIEIIGGKIDLNKYGYCP